MDTESSNRPAEDRQRPETRRFLRIGVWSLLAAVAAFLIYLLFTEGSSILVGLILTIAAAGITGVILERIDSSRHADHEGHPEDYWGFRGRPGS